jgi:hypothetical protein
MVCEPPLLRAMELAGELPRPNFVRRPVARGLSAQPKNAHGEFGEGRVGVKLKVDEEHVRRWPKESSGNRQKKNQNARCKMLLTVHHLDLDALSHNHELCATARGAVFFFSAGE